METAEIRAATASQMTSTGQPALREAYASPKTPDPMVDPTIIIAASQKVRRLVLSPLAAAWLFTGAALSR